MNNTVGKVRLVTWASIIKMVNATRNQSERSHENLLKKRKKKKKKQFPEVAASEPSRIIPPHKPDTNLSVPHMVTSLSFFPAS